ncbi:MAG: hypothetical protein QCI00_04480 [Candidatus Thermoplasmatota archaeon]|nr:hypothetical protein [Candidatus Thermoplasmatota archaeon]
MTQQLAALDIYTIVYELQDLIGSYIDKIYQISSEEILVRVNNRTTKKKKFFMPIAMDFSFERISLLKHR